MSTVLMDTAFIESNETAIMLNIIREFTISGDTLFVVPG